MDSQPGPAAGGFGNTIFALSSGRLPAGVAVVRMSGPQVRFALETIAGGVPEARRASLRRLCSTDGDLMDEALVLFFPCPASFTGEDCAEFHVHGGRAVVDALLGALAGIDGCRMAEAGEFTRRAFANGRLDLTEAEGLADLIAAETEAQRRLALMVAGGAQHSLYDGWRSDLVRARALIEADLDFADEADVAQSAADRAWDEVRVLAQRVRGYLARAKQGEIVREGFQVVILGAPNAGKSSLINALAGRDVAIVSDEAGTTRDLVEVKLDLGGVAVVVTDTAGLREAEGKVERIGVDRARRRAAEADLVLVLEDVADPVEVTGLPAGVETWRIGSKMDLVDDGRGASCYDAVISTVSGYGVDALVVALAGKGREAAGRIGDMVPTRRRHVELLAGTLRELEEGLAQDQVGAELRAEHLRRASTLLGRITGAVDVEDILDVVFGEFCIGK